MWVLYDFYARFVLSFVFFHPLFFFPIYLAALRQQSPMRVYVRVCVYCVHCTLQNPRLRRKHLPRAPQMANLGNLRVPFFVTDAVACGAVLRSLIVSAPI